MNTLVTLGPIVSGGMCVVNDGKAVSNAYYGVSG